MLNACVYVYGSPMFTQKKKADSPRYELMTQSQIAYHKGNELDSAVASADKEHWHDMQKTKLVPYNPKHLIHNKEMKKANKNYSSHLNNIEQLYEATQTGAVKMQKSPSGKKDIYTAITREHYDEHTKHHSNASTSNA